VALDSRPPRDAPSFRGRESELRTLARLLDAVRAGESRVLVIRGEPGVGKTALLEHLATQATGCRVARAAYPDLTYFNEVDTGGHFAAWEEPDLFAAEVRAAFRPLQKS
jgi:pimeloyl-ACP methyl ester carboxylesterase